MRASEYEIATFAVARRSATRSEVHPRVDARRFSRGEILEAMRAWAALYGEPPTVVDWEPSRARRLGQPWRAARFESGGWPTVRMVRSQFKIQCRRRGGGPPSETIAKPGGREAGGTGGGSRRAARVDAALRRRPDDG
jgi:hypothetical protein